LLLIPCRHSCYHECSFLFREPLGIVWKIADEEKGGNSNDYGDEAFEDKDPAPIFQPANSVHFCDSAGQEAAKCAGHYGGTEIDGETFLGLFSLVPHADDVKA